MCGHRGYGNPFSCASIRNGAWRQHLREHLTTLLTQNEDLPDQAVSQVYYSHERRKPQSSPEKSSKMLAWWIH